MGETGKMTTDANITAECRLIKALKDSKAVFVNMVDTAATEVVRDRYVNQDLFVSTWSSLAPDPSAPRNHDLRFHIIAPDVETVRVRALQAAQYIVEEFSIPEDDLDIVYDGGGKVGNIAAGDNDEFAEKADDDVRITGQADDLPDYNNFDTGVGAGDNDDVGGNVGNTVPTDAAKQHSPAASSSHAGGQRSSGNAKEGATAAVIIISISPVVFCGRPTPLMPCMNYHLARQMLDDGITNIDIDVYQRDHFVPLPNSINTAAGRFVIPLPMKELLYLDGKAVAGLAKKPKPENSLIMPTPAPEAVEWYAETLAEFEKEQHRQDDLRKTVFDNGWEVPQCIRRMMQLCLYDHNRLEAYRVISQLFAWIKAGPSEIRQIIHAVDRRNPLRDYPKIDAIITFAVENPWFAGCQHHLLRQFCPAGGCFMAELLKEYEQPPLFANNR